MPTPQRLLISCGNALDPFHHGGLPFTLLQAGLAKGFLQGGIDLTPQSLRWQRRLWNLRQLISSGMPGGFQYTLAFSNQLLQQAGLDPQEALELLSIFPFLPSHPWPDCWRVAFYIDATTCQVFGDYGFGQRIAESVKHQALHRERAAYSQTVAVICRSQWAADSVINYYGIDPAKVHVVPGGANLDEAQLAQLPPTPAPPPPSAEHPLLLGFLGTDWQRKGGPFLLQLADALSERGIPTLIRAIGPNPAQLPAHPALQPLGFINKQGDTARFVAELRSWHFGTLFSRAEAFGISNRECLRLGVPVVAHAVGGIASTLPDGDCGHLFAAHPNAADVADWIAARLNPYSDYLAWRANLAPRLWEFTWEAAVNQLHQILI